MKYIWYYLPFIAVCGGLWRRWFGGVLGDELTEWTGGLTSRKTLARFSVLVFTIPAFIYWEWWLAIPYCVYVICYFSLTQDFSCWWKVLLRYCFPLMCLGILFGIDTYYISLIVSIYLFAIWFILYNLKLIFYTEVEKFWIFDGWEAYFEFSLGCIANTFFFILPFITKEI